MGTGEVARYLQQPTATSGSAKRRSWPRSSRSCCRPTTTRGRAGRSSTASSSRAEADRYAWFTEFYENFYNLDETLGDRISQEALTASWNIGDRRRRTASAYAVVPTWIDDFRADVARQSASAAPSLILHGTADRILPIDATGRPFAARCPRPTYVEIEGAPHGLLWTHADEVNEALANFVAASALSAAA